MIILTGCDKNTEWQLPWFVDNFKTMCAGTSCKIAIADFGMTKDMREYADFSADYTIDFQQDGGWFNKVKLFNFTYTIFGDDTPILWMDTDCQIRRCPHRVFDYIERNKLLMMVDRPWTEHGCPWMAQGNSGPWYNTGVVGYIGRPLILFPWMKECETGKHRGDQEALYHVLNQDPGARFTNITEGPTTYNVLRLDREQGRGPDDPIVMHWTGHKGKEEIKRQMAK
jgi:hypothetical protein